MTLGSALAIVCLSGVAACSPRETVLGPVAPGAIQNTPIGGAGTVPSVTPSPGPSPTPSPHVTRVATPPEPLTVPRFFEAGVFAGGVGPVRSLAVSPSGDVFAAEPRLNRILVLPDRQMDGVADKIWVYADGNGLNQPSGLAFHGDWLYVANTDAIVRYRYQPGDLEAKGPPEEITPLPGTGLSPFRALVAAKDGRFFVSVAASCNACAETDVRRAAVLSFPGEPDGRGQLWSSGLRAVGGLALNPETGELWATEDSRDDQGDDQPEDELNLLVAGAHFGWPYCFGAAQFDPTVPGGDPATCTHTAFPVVTFPAHVTPAGLTFYTGRQFPAEYAGSLFVAFYGSSSRSLPVGYSIMRIPFAGGRPSGPAVAFVTGWLRPDTRRWGRPADLAIAADGALLVADEAGEKVYRIFYAEPATPTPGF